MGSVSLKGGPPGAWKGQGGSGRFATDPGGTSGRQWCPRAARRGACVAGAHSTSQPAWPGFRREDGRKPEAIRATKERGGEGCACPSCSALRGTYVSVGGSLRLYFGARAWSEGMFTFPRLSTTVRLLRFQLS